MHMEVCCDRRKNVGYLWAIEHGATQILDMEDDVQLKAAGLPTMTDMEHYMYNASGEPSIRALC